MSEDSEAIRTNPYLAKAFHVYDSYKGAYTNAEALYRYMWERWRSDSIQYRFMNPPEIDSKFGVIQERA